MEFYDVIIAGAGPSGSTCAGLCSKSGLKTLLVDRDVFPRIKPCGGALSEFALQGLDFELPTDLIERECFGARVHYGDIVSNITENHRIAAFVSRERFDSFLLEKAKESGSDILLGKQVSEIKINRDFATVKAGDQFFKSLMVVGADGVNSTVSRYVRKPYGKEELLFTLYERLYESKRGIEEKQGKIMDLFFGRIKFGYGWVFPHDEYYSLGIGGLYSSFKNPKTIYENFARSAGFSPRNIKGYFLPLGGVKRPLAGERIILAGDAAGFVDPLTGEGIAYAIHSGRTVSGIIQEAIKKNNYSKDYLFSSYLKRFKIRKNIESSLRLARIIHSYPDIFLKQMISDGKALKKYFEIPRGNLTYGKYTTWLAGRLPMYFFKSLCQK